MKRVDKTQN